MKNWFYTVHLIGTFSLWACTTLIHLEYIKNWHDSYWYRQRTPMDISKVALALAGFWACKNGHFGPFFNAQVQLFWRNVGIKSVAQVKIFLCWGIGYYLKAKHTFSHNGKLLWSCFKYAAKYNLEKKKRKLRNDIEKYVKIIILVEFYWFISILPFFPLTGL